MLKAGFGEVDITPWRGVQLGGDIGRHRPARWVRDRIYARAAALEGDGVRILIISLGPNALEKAE
ncbi:MAG: hypothetical protein FWF86_03850, partial [Clostridia bacterium]|nr:hypothetical protein [Clostridia bacterium]